MTLLSVPLHNVALRYMRIHYMTCRCSTLDDIALHGVTLCIALEHIPLRSSTLHCLTWRYRLTTLHYMVLEEHTPQPHQRTMLKRLLLPCFVLQLRRTRVRCAASPYLLILLRMYVRTPTPAHIDTSRNPYVDAMCTNGHGIDSHFLPAAECHS